MTVFESGNFFVNAVDAIVICLFRIVSFESNSGEDGLGTGVCFGFGGKGISLGRLGSGMIVLLNEVIIFWEKENKCVR